MTSSSSLAVVILAAGKGTRMNNPGKAKVMFAVSGTPMIDYVVRQALSLEAAPVVVVVGYEKQSVMDYLSSVFPSQVTFASQDAQLGTGHAVMQTRDALAGYAGNVLILSGDVPLLRGETLLAFAESHNASGAVLSVLSVTAPDPTGYGRIIRDADGNFERIVEHKDASEQERSVDEINSGIYIVDAEHLFSALDDVSNDNVQGEYYLTDIVSILRNRNLPVHAWRSDAYGEVQGINTVDQLTAAEEYLQGVETERP
jgi:UDP-N-acetylglucosamine diphosphorylase/glucosamine-1-phosphate N-acetyltransferase